MSKKSKILVVFFGLLAFFFWRLSWNCFQDINWYQTSETGYYNKSIKREMYDDIVFDEKEEDSLVEFALWSQENEQTVKGKETLRESQVSILWIAGDTRAIFPYGPVLDREDREGCLIDEDTAIKIFGNSNATGATIHHGEKSYLIRGVLKSPKHIVVLPANKETPLDRISVIGQAEQRKEFLSRNGLSPTGKTESSIYYDIAKIFLFVPLIILCIWLLQFFVKQAYQYRLKPFPWVVFLILSVAVATIIFLVLLWLLPHQMIPPKWAEFEFWSTFGKGFQTSWKNYLGVPKYAPDIRQISVMLKVFLVFPCVFCLFQSRKYLRKK